MGNYANPGGSFIVGRKTVAAAATAEALSTDTTGILSVLVTAETDNTGIITVGGSSVVGALATRKGHPLQAGESVELGINNLTKVYLDTTVNGDGVTFLALVA